MNLLTVEHLSKTHAGQLQPSVANVSVKLKKGEILGLIGESGSGKTTLLRLIAGLEDTDSGAIRLNGQSVTGPSRNLVPGHPQIRLVHQDFRLSPTITVAANIAYALRAYDAHYRNTRTAAVMRLCDLTALAHKLPRQLSGGEMQRVALAVALADEPLLLLLDEPFSNADALRRQQLKQDIAHILRQSRTTAIFVTHDTAEALALSDTIAVMQHGQFVQTGTPRHIYQQPASPYVAGLFGYANTVAAKDLRKYWLPNGRKWPYQPDDLLCLRAEAIHPCPESEADFAGTVTDSHYLGMYAVWEVTVQRKIQWKMLIFEKTDEATEKKTALRKKIFLAVDWPRVHVFNR